MEGGGRSVYLVVLISLIAASRTEATDAADPKDSITASTGIGSQHLNVELQGESFLSGKPIMMYLPSRADYLRVNVTWYAPMYDFEVTKTFSGPCYRTGHAVGFLSSMATLTCCLSLQKGTYTKGHSELFFTPYRQRHGTVHKDVIRSHVVRNVSRKHSKIFEHHVVLETSCLQSFNTDLVLRSETDKMIVLLVISMLLLLASCIVGRNRKCAPTQTDDGSGLEEKVTLVPRSFGLKARQRHSLPASGDVAKVKDPSAPVDSLPFTPPYLRDESRQANSTPIVLADGRWFPDQAAFYRYYAKGCVGVLNPNFDE